MAKLSVWCLYCSFHIFKELMDGLSLFRLNLVHLSLDCHCIAHSTFLKNFAPMDGLSLFRLKLVHLPLDCHCIAHSIFLKKFAPMGGLSLFRLKLVHLPLDCHLLLALCSRTWPRT